MIVTDLEANDKVVDSVKNVRIGCEVDETYRYTSRPTQ